MCAPAVFVRTGESAWHKVAAECAAAPAARTNSHPYAARMASPTGTAASYSLKLADIDVMCKFFTMDLAVRTYPALHILVPFSNLSRHIIK